MVKYNELLEELESISEVDFADFQRRIIRDGELKILGVRTPQLRKLAKKYSGKYELFTQFPNEYYEVVFLKLTLAAQLPYEGFVAVLDDCVRLITDWALCDLFTTQCIKKRRDDFILYIKKYLAAGDGYYNGGEYARRFSLRILLSFYVEEKYLPFIFESISCCNPDKYYVVMGAAWLLAEVLIKHYEAGFKYLHSTTCDINVKNKAISKACDSFRVSAERKAELKALRG